MTATPVLADARVQTVVYQQQSKPIAVEEPIKVSIRPYTPPLPDIIWPGQKLTWIFAVTNVGPKDYWVQTYVRVDAAERDVYFFAKKRINNEAEEDMYQPFLLPANATYIVTLIITIAEDSPTATVRLVPTISRVAPPPPGIPPGLG